MTKSKSSSSSSSSSSGERNNNGKKEEEEDKNKVDPASTSVSTSTTRFVANMLRKKRKEEGRRLKRQRIDQAGGVRPRQQRQNNDSAEEQQQQQQRKQQQTSTTNKLTTVSANTKASRKSNHPALSPKDRGKYNKKKYSSSTLYNGGGGGGSSSWSSSSFGRVMENVPCPGRPRFSTVSIAVPGSIVCNRPTKELRTLLVGQIARAATIYHVDEIVVYNDPSASPAESSGAAAGASSSSSSLYRRATMHRKQQQHNGNNPAAASADGAASSSSPNGSATDDHQSHDSNPNTTAAAPFDPDSFVARILQYCECPQYLRRHFFPICPELSCTGLLPPVDAPHHVRAGDACRFREGVTLNKFGHRNGGGGTLVNCGIRGRPVEIDLRLEAGIRCTVEILDPSEYSNSSGGTLRGRVVSPSVVPQCDGTYWGYTVRMASNLIAALEECPWQDDDGDDDNNGEKGFYDLCIGTSERGDVNLDDLILPQRHQQQRQQQQHGVLGGGGFGTYRHALIVFGGVAGLEECVNADESIPVTGAETKTLFDHWINICPWQGSRTIRTEEAVWIGLAKLSPLLLSAAAAAAGGAGGTSAAAAQEQAAPATAAAAARATAATNTRAGRPPSSKQQYRGGEEETVDTTKVDFSDESPSDESSSDDDDDDDDSDAAVTSPA